MKRAMILTVGTGTRADVSIVRPLVKTIQNSRPDFTVLVVSEASRSFAEQIVKTLGLDLSEYLVCDLDDPENIEKIFKTINSLIRKLVAQGYACEDIVVDYTSGTKAMTGGLLLSAVGNGCGELKYISGQRQAGVVVDGTERFIPIPPSAIVAHGQIRTAIRFLRAYRFDAALDMLKNLNLYLLDDYDRALLDSLTSLATGFRAWDQFDHKYFLGEYGKADFGLDELKPFEVCRGTWPRLAGIKKVIERNEGAVTEDMLADLFNNASRRVEEARYDDAMARLYRLAEMLGQWALAGFGLSSSDVDLAKAPEHSRPELEKYRDHFDGKIKIGLFKVYDLLAELGSNLGRDFRKDSRIRNLVTIRNYSILAHGVKPVTRDQCLSMRRILERLLTDHVPEFGVRTDELRFPWSVGLKD